GRPSSAARFPQWRLYSCSAAYGKGQNFSLLAGNDGLNVVGPQRQRGAHLALIAYPVVNSRDARPVAALVIEHGLNNVRQHAEVSQPGGNAAPNVVHNPARDS